MFPFILGGFVGAAIVIIAKELIDSEACENDIDALNITKLCDTRNMLNAKIEYFPHNALPNQNRA